MATARNEMMGDDGTLVGAENHNREDTAAPSNIRNEEIIEVTGCYVFKIGLGLLFLFADIVFDIVALIDIYHHCSSWFFVAALYFIFSPAVITNVISWFCYRDDHDTSKISACLHFLSLGYVTRLCKLLCLANKLSGEKKPTEREAIEEYRHRRKRFGDWYAEAAMIGVMDALLESDPQAILQMSRIIPGNPDDDFNFGFQRTCSAVISCLTVGFAIASYHVAIRMTLPQTNRISHCGYFIHWFWHLFITASRLVSLACLLAVFPLAVLIGGVLHIFLALGYLYIFKMGPERDYESHFRNFCVHLLIAFGYLFYVIPVRNVPSRNFYITMYLVFFIENGASMIYWYCHMSNHLALMMVIFSFVTFVLGIIFMLVYYSGFYPTKLVTSNGSSSPYAEVPQNELQAVHNE